MGEYYNIIICLIILIVYRQYVMCHGSKYFTSIIMCEMRSNVQLQSLYYCYSCNESTPCINHVQKHVTLILYEHDRLC